MAKFYKISGDMVINFDHVISFAWEEKKIIFNCIELESGVWNEYKEFFFDEDAAFARFNFLVTKLCNWIE